MNDTPSKIAQLSPDQLMRTFTQSRLLVYTVLAVVLHVGVLAGTSTSYVMDLIDPSRVTTREAEVEAKRQATIEAAQAKAEQARAAKVAAANQTKTEQTTGDQKQAPVVERTQEVASPDELPSKPDDLGISDEQLGL